MGNSTTQRKHTTYICLISKKKILTIYFFNCLVNSLIFNEVHSIEQHVKATFQSKCEQQIFVGEQPPDPVKNVYIFFKECLIINFL